VVVGETATGVPEITPVVVLIVKPAGSAGEIANVLLAPSVVVARIGVGWIAAPTRATTVCVTGVSWPAAATVKRTVATPKLAPSETVITYVEATLIAVGVPDITPVDAFIDNPLGNVGVMENTLVPVTAAAVRADVGVNTTPTNPVTVCEAGDTAVADTDAADTVMAMVAVAEAVPSDAVTV
jgi:hypothetical protein